MLDSGDPSVFDIRTAVPGPKGALPLTPEMLITRPSGDLFGLTQNVGMGWAPEQLGGKEVLILSTHGACARRTERRSPLAIIRDISRWALLVEAAAQELNPQAQYRSRAHAPTRAMDGRKEHRDVRQLALSQRRSNDFPAAYTIAAYAMPWWAWSPETRFTGDDDGARCDARFAFGAGSGGVTLMPSDGDDAGRVQSMGPRFMHGEMTLQEAAEMGCRACASRAAGVSS